MPFLTPFLVGRVPNPTKVDREKLVPYAQLSTGGPPQHLRSLWVPCSGRPRGMATVGAPKAGAAAEQRATRLLCNKMCHLSVPLRCGVREPTGTPSILEVPLFQTKNRCALSTRFICSVGANRTSSRERRQLLSWS